MLQGKEYICKTIVTSDLLNVMAEKSGVKHYDVLTGFKYIADIIKRHEGKMKFIGGGEESYGYLAGEFVRDKDAVLSCSLIAEVTAWALHQNKSLFDILIDIYLEFGFYKESLISIVRKGKAGAEEIQQIMTRFRTNPPAEINHSKLITIHDYLSSKTINILKNTEEEIDLPSSNVLQFELKDGSKISIRPSGTEPKIKFYFSVNEELTEKSEYAKIDALLEEKINNIKKDLELI